MIERYLKFMQDLQVTRAHGPSKMASQSSVLTASLHYPLARLVRPQAHGMTVVKSLLHSIRMSLRSLAVLRLDVMFASQTMKAV